MAAPEGKKVSDFTTYAEVRAALGVSEEEIDDATIETGLYQVSLQEDLLALDPTIFAHYTVLDSDPDSQSALQQRFYGLTRLYATYCVAFHLLDSVNLFGYLKVTDGRAEVQRAKDAFATLRANITAMRTRVGNLLLNALNGLDPSVTLPTAVTLSLVGSAGIPFDPVTNV